MALLCSDVVDNGRVSEKRTHPAIRALQQLSKARLLHVVESRVLCCYTIGSGGWGLCATGGGARVATAAVGSNVYRTAVSYRKTNSKIEALSHLSQPQAHRNLAAQTERTTQHPALPGLP